MPQPPAVTAPAAEASAPGERGRLVDLSVVVVSYNTRRLLRACLSSLFEQTRGMELQVIVVDNASSDGSPAMVAEEFPSVELLALQENVGFARACNMGAGTATGRDLLLLNPDTVVLDRAVNRLVAFAHAHPEAGICGGRTLAGDGSVDPSSCLGAPTLWSLACYALGLSALFRRSALFNPEYLGGWARDSVRHVEVVTGCLLLLPKRLWDDLGGFDSRFFMYGEDVDLCLRAASLGFRPAITPEATIVHLVGSSTPSKAEKKSMVLKGRVTVMAKHWSPAAVVVGRGMLAAGVAVRAAGARLSTALGARRPHPSPWPELWRRRREWLAGWGPTQGG